MALRDTRWAWDQALPPTTKLVLLALAECINGRGPGVCYPGQERLAAMCGLKVRQTRNILGDLEARGLIETTPRPGDGKGRKTNLYRLIPEQGTLDLACQYPVDKSGGNRQCSSGCLGGATGNFQQATGNPVPVASLYEPEERTGRIERGATTHTTTSRTSEPAPKTLSQDPGFDFVAIARKIRPDIADPGPSWAKFLAYHTGRTLDPSTVPGAWALWISREVENHKGQCIITGSERPFGSFLDRARPVLKAEVTEDSHERPRSARV